MHMDSKTTGEDGDKVARQCTAVLQPGFFLSNTLKEVPSMRQAQAQAQDDISDGQFYRCLYAFLLSSRRFLKDLSSVAIVLAAMLVLTAKVGRSRLGN